MAVYTTLTIYHFITPFNLFLLVYITFPHNHSITTGKVNAPKQKINAGIIEWIMFELNKIITNTIKPTNIRPINPTNPISIYQARSISLNVSLGIFISPSSNYLTYVFLSLL